MIVKKHLMQAVVILLMPVLSIALIQCGINLYAPSYDAKMGADLDKQIRSSPKEYPVLNDESVRSYVQNIANELANSPAVKYRGTFPYKVEIINDPKTLNAFCTPGGYIYVYTGIIKALDNEASLSVDPLDMRDDDDEDFW